MPVIRLYKKHALKGNSKAIALITEIIFNYIEKLTESFIQDRRYIIIDTDAVMWEAGRRAYRASYNHKLSVINRQNA